MRYVCLSALLALSAFAPSAAFGQLQGLSIPATSNSYQYVSEQRVTRSTSNVTYSATLVNTGAALASVTATLTSLDPAHIQVVAGQGVLNFAPVPANSQVQSSNTFTVLVDRTVAFDFTKLQWTFQAVSQAPVANAGPNQQVKLNSTVTLNGSGSTNPSGIGTLTYSWAFTSKPAGSNAALTNPTSVMPTFVPDVQGNYVVALTVSNGVASNTASVTISTTTPPPPVANAGPNQTVTQGATVVLNGSGSTSPSGNPLTYAWTLTVPAGSTAVLTGANTVSPTFVADKPNATYTATLIVNDGIASSAPSSVTITTGVVAPVANAGASQTVNVNTVVQLNGSGSTDANGLPLTYLWSLISRPPGSAATLSSTTAVNPTFTADQQGTYMAQLIVNNGQLSSTPSTVTITTNVVLAPTANAGTAQTVNVGSLVTLNGSGTDPQNLPLTFKWTLLNKPAGSTAVLSSTTIANPTFTADLAGPYVAQLIVNNGFKDSAASTVTISTTCSQPTANAGPTQNVLVGATVKLDGSKSGDACNDPLKYSWTLTTVPAGSTATLTGATTASPTFVADVVGTYVAQLIVDNGFSKSNPATVTINVGSLPTITFTPNPLGIFTGGTATLTVTLSNTAGAVINLVSGNTAFATVPSTVTVAAGSATATVTVTGVAVGSTTITGTASGFTTGTVAVNVTPPPAISVANTTVNLGQTASLAVTLSVAAPAGGLTVTLGSSDSTKVSVPGTISFAAGATSGTATVTGVGIGSATITATAAGYTSGTGTVTVPAPTLSFTGSPLSITLPGTGTLTLNLAGGQAPAGGLTVNLVSSDATKATVPATVNFAAGATSATVTVTGVAAGGPVTITASATGIASATATVNVAPPPAITVANLSVNLGQTGNLQITLATAAPAGGLTVNLISSDAAIATVPATITIAAGTTGTAIVTAVGIGSATITASATGYTSGSGTVTVTAPVLGFTGSPLSIIAGTTGTLTLTLTNGQAPAGGLTVNLISSDATKATVPATVNFAAGATSATVTVTGVAAGSATITASAAGIPSATATVNVAPPPAITVANLSVNLGLTGNLQITLATAAPVGGLTVNLISSDATKVTVPATVTVAAGATTATATVTAVGIGSATITASATGYTSGSGTVTVTAPTLAFTGSPLSINTGATGTLTLTLTGGQAPTGGLTVNLVSSDPTKASVPATVTFAAGATSASVTVTGVAATVSPVTITASAAGINSPTASVTVTNPISILLPASTTIGLGQTATFPVTLSVVAPAGGITVNLSSGNTSKVTISPASVIIAAGATTPATQPTVTGAGVGSATITASAAGVTPVTPGTGTVTVTPPTATFSDSPLTISVGSQGTLRLQLTGGQAPAGGLVFTLSSSDTTKATVPPAVTILAGMSSAIVTPVTGVNAGTATITASSAGIVSATGTVNVMQISPLLLPILVPSVSVGQNLETSITVSLLTETSCSQLSTTCAPKGPGGALVVIDPATQLPVISGVPAPTGGLIVSLTSSDPAKLLVSGSAGCPGNGNVCGAQQVKFTIPQGLSTASGVYLQGLVSSGTVTLTASAPGFPSGQATITLTPSGFQLTGPGGTSTFTTSAGAPATALTVTPVRLDASLNVAEFQQVRGGYNDPINGPFDDAQGSQSGFPFANLSGLFKAVVPVSSSSTAVGTATAATLNGGDSSGISQFIPDKKNTGSTTLTAVAPAGFSTPTSGTTVNAIVNQATTSCAAVTVGQNLEIIATCSLQGGAPTAGVPVTITSSDPAKFTLSVIPKGSTTCTDPGSNFITLTTVNASQGGTNIVIPSFCVYGVANSGAATYSVSLNGYAPANGTVNLAPSGFVIAGPGGIGQASFTPISGTSTITVSSALLDASLNFVSVQPLAIGQSASVNLTSSNLNVGTLSPTTLSFTGGMSSNTSTFTSGNSGATTLSVSTPAGFSTPANDTSVTAIITPKGFALTCDTNSGTIIGLNLEMSCGISVFPAVTADTIVTVNSNSGSLLLSNTATSAGTATIGVLIPAGNTTGSFFAQSLAGSGTATYTVSAPGGFTTRNGTVKFAPSGVVIAGPFGVGTSFFFSNVNVPVPLTVALAPLFTDPASCPQVTPPAVGTPCYAGVTQQLRGGLPSVSITVTTSFGTVTSPVTIAAGQLSATSTFTATSTGQAMVSVVTPAGFTTSTNDTTLTTNVNP